MARNSSKSATSSMVTGFIALGMVDGFIGILWPSIGKHFGIGMGYLGAILTVITIGAAISSSTVSRLLKLWGVGLQTMLFSTIILVSILIYITTDSWYVFILAAFLFGIGAGGLDSGINAFSARNKSTSFLNHLHALYGIGITLGPVMATLVIEYGKWQETYLFILPLFVGLIFGALFFAPLTPATMTMKSLDNIKTPHRNNNLTGPMLILSAFFLYAAIEVTTGQWAFTFLTQVRGFPVLFGGLSTALFWASLTLGRLVTGTLASNYSNRRILILSTIGTASGLMIFGLVPMDIAAFAGLMIMGLSLGPFFPTLVASIPHMVGEERSNFIVGMSLASSNSGVAIVSLMALTLINYAGLFMIIPLLISISLILVLVVFTNLSESMQINTF